MPRYKCTYINSSGQKAEVSVEAMSKDIAILKFRSVGLSVTSIQREESQKQSPKPEPQQNFASWAQKNNLIPYQSSFKSLMETKSAKTSETPVVAEQSYFELEKPEFVSQGQLHIFVNYPGFGDVYLDVHWEDGNLKDIIGFWRNEKRTPEYILQYVQEMLAPHIKVLDAVRTSDINNENKFCVRLRQRLSEFFSATNYEDVHEQLLPECKKHRCPKCASQQLSFTQQSSQSYNAGKGLVGNLVFGTVGALSGFESYSFERIHCMECGESWYASNTKDLCELHFNESFEIESSLELLKKLYDNCLAEAERNEVLKNYKSALCELATAIYYRLHCQTLLSAKERFNEKVFYTLCGEKVYNDLYMLLDATELTFKYNAVKKAIVDASFIKNRAWAQKDLSEAIDKLFADKGMDTAEIVDVNDTFFVFNCPYCGKMYKTSTASRGAYINCKNCNHSIEIK